MATSRCVAVVRWLDTASGFLPIAIGHRRDDNLRLARNAFACDLIRPVVVNLSPRPTPMMPTPQPVPPACPNCTGTATLLAIAVTRDARTLSYACDACRHAWDVTDTDSQQRWSVRRSHGSLFAK